MIAFVSKLAAHARARKAGFLVVPQNGEALLTDPAYRAVIDGIGKEDILYGETKDKRPNKPASIAANVAKLKLLTAEGKPVFAVEYLDSPEEIAKARKQLLDYGFIPHFADRAPRPNAHRRSAQPQRQAGQKIAGLPPAEPVWTLHRPDAIKRPRLGSGTIADETVFDALLHLVER